MKILHIFHYKCIENLIDHHFSKCPYCRSDIKMGEKKENNNSDNNDYNDDYNYLNEITYYMGPY